jgi:hypothetical protein
MGMGCHCSIVSPWYCRKEICFGFVPAAHCELNSTQLNTKPHKQTTRILFSNFNSTLFSNFIEKPFLLLSVAVRFVWLHRFNTAMLN